MITYTIISLVAEIRQMAQIQKTLPQWPEANESIYQYLWSLNSPVSSRVVGDVECVNSQVFHTKSPSDTDCVSYCNREVR